MRERTLTRALFAATSVATSVFLLYAFTHPTAAPLARQARTTGSTAHPELRAAPTPTGASPATTPASVVDVGALLHPASKYLGVARNGVPDSMAGLAQFSEQFGVKPDIVAYYVPWGQPLNQTWVLNLADDGILPLIQFEPATPIAQIAAGASDSYTTALAQTIKALNVPVVFSFGHEMNGDWYAWGTDKTNPADFVKAWRRIHDIFTTVGATGVIWLWDANVVYPVPNIPLEPLYPGDAYVDWIGLTGYYRATAGGRATFATLFTPTMEQIRRFSSKPFLIAETAAAPGPHKPTEIENLFAGVEEHSDVLGFVWFDCAKTGANETNWMIDSDPASSAAFRTLAHDPRWHSRYHPDVHPLQ